MITNTAQLKSTREWISRFRSAITEHEKAKQEGKGDIDTEVSIARNHSQLNKLEAEVAEYLSLTSGSMDYINPRKLEDLPKTMIQLRLALGWSQKKLADELGVAQQHIARYEASDYEGISFQRMLVMLDAFSAHISIEKIRMTIDGESQEQFLLPSGMSREMYAEPKHHIVEHGFFFKSAS